MSHRFVLLAENETGVAEARISSWATIEESAPRAGNPPQVIDGFAVSGGFGDPAGGVALPLEEDEYTVTVPAGGFLTVIIEGSCNATTEVRVVDQSGTQLGQSSSNMGLCPGKIRVGPTGWRAAVTSTSFCLGCVHWSLSAWTTPPRRRRRISLPTPVAAASPTTPGARTTMR